MPDLVTLNAAPYNPYNDTFARFAMEGLQMGMSMMAQKDQLAQRQSEQLSSIVSENTRNLWKGVETQMQNKELNHRIENDKFNNALKQEELQFSKESFWSRFGLQQREQSFQEEKFQFSKEFEQDKFAYEKRHNREIDDPFKQAQTERLEQQNLLEEKSLPTQLETDRLRVEELRLKNENQTFENTMNQQTTSFYKEHPDFLGKEKQAKLDYMESQTTVNDAHAKAYESGGASREASWNQLVMRQQTLIKSKNSLSDELQKNTPPPIASMSEKDKADPKNKAYIEQHKGDVDAFQKRKEDLERQIQAIDGNLNDIAISLEHVKPNPSLLDNNPTNYRNQSPSDSPDISPVPPPASSQSTVPLPGQVPDPALDTLNRANKNVPASKSGNPYSRVGNSTK